jgi:osmotically-inducible protein OsmY
MFRLFGLLLVGLVLAGCQTREVADVAAADLVAQAHFRSKLMSDTDIRASEYSFDVKDGVIKIYGLARSKSEMNKVMTHATSLKFIKKIVSYIELEGDTNLPDGS